MTEKKQELTEEREALPLSKAAQYLILECRLILPGLEALLGFQLMVVFQTSFSERLSPLEQQLHLLALGFGAVAAAILMTPAAYHRQTNVREVTAGFITVSSRLLMAAMPLMALSICTDFYLIARMLLGPGIGAGVAAGVFAVFVVLWFVLPRVRGLRRALGDRNLAQPAHPTDADSPAPPRTHRRVKKAH
jgi:hypothetical protein